MTDYIPITTPTIKMNRCSKGTDYYQKQKFCSASFFNTHTHTDTHTQTHLHTHTHTHTYTHIHCNQILKHTRACTHTHTHIHTHTHTHTQTFDHTCSATRCNHALQTANNVVYMGGKRI